MAAEAPNQIPHQTPPPPARVFQSPKYVQQEGVLARIGEWVASVFPKASKAALITSARLKKQYWEQLSQSVVDPGGGQVG